MKRRYVYEFSTTYNVRKGTEAELRALVFRAGVLLATAQQKRAVKIRRQSGSWVHGWIAVNQQQRKLIVRGHDGAVLASFSASQLRKAVNKGFVEVCYGLRNMNTH
jgi:hypothetical protein